MHVRHDRTPFDDSYAECINKCGCTSDNRTLTVCSLSRIATDRSKSAFPNPRKQPAINMHVNRSIAYCSLLLNRSTKTTSPRCVCVCGRYTARPSCLLCLISLYGTRLDDSCTEDPRRTNSRGPEPDFQTPGRHLTCCFVFIML